MTLRADSRADPLDDLLEALPVLARLDRVDVGADQLDAVLLEHARLVQGDRGVERGLAAEGGEQRVGALLGDDRLDDVGGDRLDVGGVGELGVGHDRRRVAVDEDDPQALRAEHPAGLRAGVVELGGLADDDRPGADDEDARCRRASASALPSLVPLAHQVGEAVEEVAGVVRAGRRLGVVLHREGRDVEAAQPLDDAVVEPDVADLDPAEVGGTAASSGASTAKPWLCAVTSTRPVARSSTGWLMPRWPYPSLYVPSPSARPSSWLPKQIPKNGRPRREHRPQQVDRAGRAAGSPGPLEKNTPSGCDGEHVASVADAGSTCTSMPRSAIRRGVIALIPRSIAATVSRRSPTRRHDVGRRRRDLAGEVGAGHGRGRAGRRPRGPRRARWPRAPRTRPPASPRARAGAG